MTPVDLTLSSVGRISWPAAGAAIASSSAPSESPRRSRVTMPQASTLLAEETPGAGGKAAVALVGTDDDEGRALAAAGHADRVLRALDPVEQRSLHDRLNDRWRQHRAGGGRTVHLELTTRHGGLHRHALLAIEELALAHTPAGEQRREHHERDRARHGDPPHATTD